MAWFKVNDRLVSHPAAGCIGDEALGYWMRLGCWLAAYPSQGDHIPHAVAVGLLHKRGRGKFRKLHALIEAGMLVPHGDGYRMYPRLDICGSGVDETAWLIDLPAIRRKHIPTSLRAAVYDRDGHACLECGATGDLSLDHIHPWSKGGADTYDNLRTLCRPCNSAKGART